MAVDEKMYSRGRRGKGLLFHQLLDSLEEDDEEVPDTVFICPPNEPAGTETDKDSDNSDEEVTGDVDHLPSRILRSKVLVHYNEDINDSDENIHGDESEEYDSDNFETPIPSTSRQTFTRKRNAPAQKVIPNSKTARTDSKKSVPKEKEIPLIWKNNESIFTSKIPEFLEEFGPTIDDFLKETVKNPLDSFRAYFTSNVSYHITAETNRYAGQKLVHNLHATEEEIMTFVGVMLSSGYQPLPNRRFYWKLDPDVHCSLVSDAMRRNRFDELMSFIHLADNQSNDGTDGMYKVRPLFDLLNPIFKQIPAGSEISIDESMIPYYGRHHNKQFIRGKPIRFGYKLWVAADPSGYIQHAEPYCGSATRLPKTHLGQGGDVVLGLINHIQIKKGTKLYFDNLFTSIGLMKELTDRGLGGTGTLRENRCSTAMNLPEKKQFKKTSRGAVAVSTSDHLLLVRWNDNNVVTVLTNCEPLHPMKKSNRYSRVEKKTISVDVPGPLAKYNSNMGGVDLSDQFLATYRCRIRSKKWWWPYFSWAVDLCCTQGWLLYRRLGHEMPLLDFKRHCAIQILKTFDSAPRMPGVRSSLQFSSALEEIRKDGKGHIVEQGTSKYRRCKICGSRTSFICAKCDIPLHPANCFKVFHEK